MAHVNQLYITKRSPLTKFYSAVERLYLSRNQKARDLIVRGIRTKFLACDRPIIPTLTKGYNNTLH